MRKKIIVIVSIIIGIGLLAVAVNALVSGSWQGAGDNLEAGIADKDLKEGENAAAVNDNGSPSDEKAPQMDVEMGSSKGKPGGEVSLAVIFKNVPAKGINNCDFKLEYDSEIFESIEVAPADILGKSTSNFSSFVNKDNGTISFLFLDNTLGEEPITKGGSFATIKCKIKKSAPAGDTEIKLKSVGAFADIDLNKIQAEFSAGTISVTE
ncbi:cohesin domain-containing protein [Anaerobacterium chartisolvens]|uniref:Cohesin domain-containing protein n=1 Tax=Anaerobacterium chartisolvens TaxID=1297424 RepID=A0A369AJ42_9FIRM|nr:cohesin domain-containing protein [Anaerobacterium chartisolvens]RCX09105.1 cohesin domain-containing protein [Anaerobacterium chartisolvens]